MPELQMGGIEARFADIIWESEPVSGAALVKKAEAAFGWKRTTTYTVLKRLCGKGIFQNDGGTVTSRMSREDYYARRSNQYVEETFQGSLPAFFSSASLARRESPILLCWQRIKMKSSQRKRRSLYTLRCRIIIIRNTKQVRPIHIMNTTK